MKLRSKLTLLAFGLAFGLSLLLPSSLVAQQGLKSTRFTSTGNSGAIRLVGSGVAWHKLTWSKTGTVTLCSVRIDSSVDGITWSDGDILGATDCSSNGSSAIISAVYNFCRVRVTSWTGTGSVTTVWTGYINSPSSGTGHTIVDEVTTLPTESKLTFLGAGVTCVDNGAGTSTDCTIPGGAGVSNAGNDLTVPNADKVVTVAGAGDVKVSSCTVVAGVMTCSSFATSGSGPDTFTPVADGTTANSFWLSSSTANVFKAYVGGALKQFAFLDSNITGTAANVSGTPALPNGTTATSQTDADNSTKLATTAYVDAHAVAAAKIPAVTVTVNTSSPVTVSTTLNAELHYNQHATAGTAMVYNLPATAVGKQFCFKNSYNGSAANTGTLTITPAASSYIIKDGVLSTISKGWISGGAAGDAACVVGVDATHWSLHVGNGTWTAVP